VQRPLADELDPDGGRQMHDDVHGLHQPVHPRRIGGGADHERDAVVQVGEIAAPARRQVVERDDVRAFGGEEVAEVRADESGASGDEIGRHVTTLLRGCLEDTCLKV
jgi:hypothetical protein